MTLLAGVCGLLLSTLSESRQKLINSQNELEGLNVAIMLSRTNKSQFEGNQKVLLTKKKSEWVVTYEDKTLLKITKTD